jgi:NAD(P)H-dependent FMN reductase
MTDEKRTRTMAPCILAFAGSLHRESFNKKLVSIAAKGARHGGAEVTLIGLGVFPLPLFDQDLEARQGMPENGKMLQQLFIDHDGLLIASPEYNNSITAMLKTAIDWVSRPAPGEPSLVAFRSISSLDTPCRSDLGATGPEAHFCPSAW